MRDIPEQYCEIVRQSPNKPQLWLGMEYQISLPLMFTCIYIFYGGMALGHMFWGIFVMFAFWKTGAYLGRLLAKKDPRFIAVYRKSFRWRDYYPATATAVPMVRRRQ